MDRHEMKAKRLDLGLTQQQMADRLFMSRQHYCAMENGDKKITARTAAQVTGLRRSRGAS